MKTIDVQQVDRAVFDVSHALVECALQQCRKRAEALVVKRTQLVEDFGTVETSVRVTLPSVDGMAAGANPCARDRVAKGAVGNPVCVPSSTKTRGDVAHTIQCANGTCSHQALSAPSRSARQNSGSRDGSASAASVSVQRKSRCVVTELAGSLLSGSDCCGSSWSIFIMYLSRKRYRALARSSQVRGCQ